MQPLPWRIIWRPAAWLAKNVPLRFTARVRSKSSSVTSTAAFSGPTYHSIGDESGANLLRGCSLHILDLSVSRTIPLGGNRNLQVRADFFNAFNSVIYNAVQFTEQLNNPAAPTTVTNNQYLADGTLNPARLQPQTAGFGAVTGAQPMRTAQLHVRFQF